MNKEEIVRKVFEEKSRKLSISRVPVETKKLFMEFSEKEFEGDYGMCLREILQGYMEYQRMKWTFFENMNLKLDKLLHSQVERTEEPEGVTMLDGTKRQLFGKKARTDKGVSNNE